MRYARLPSSMISTLEEARLSGLDEVATLIDSGSPAPGIIMRYATPQFLEIYQNADIVISKGPKEGLRRDFPEWKNGSYSFFLGLKGPNWFRVGFGPVQFFGHSKGKGDYWFFKRA